jgi:hypothetical protein
MEMKTFVRANADRVIAVGLVLVGVVALVVGWFGVSGTGLAAEQIPYLVSGGLGGVVLIVIGCTAWVSADLQDEWRRLDAIEEQLEQLASVNDVDARDTAPTNPNGRASHESSETSIAPDLPA